MLINNIQESMKGTFILFKPFIKNLKKLSRYKDCHVTCKEKYVNRKCIKLIENYLP